MRVINSRRMRWAGHVARMSRREAFTEFWWGNHSGDPDVDGRIILNWILRKWDVGDIDWMELAQKRDRWRALVNVVMKIRVL